MIPVPTVTHSESMGDRETREEIRRLHVESNLWRYGKFTVDWNGLTIAAHSRYSFSVNITPKDYILAAMSMHVSPTEAAMTAGIAIANEWTQAGVLYCDFINYTGADVAMPSDPVTYLYHGVLVRTLAVDGSATIIAD